MRKTVHTYMRWRYGRVVESSYSNIHITSIEKEVRIQKNIQTSYRVVRMATKVHGYLLLCLH